MIQSLSVGIVITRGNEKSDPPRIFSCFLIETPTLLNLDDALWFCI